MIRIVLTGDLRPVDPIRHLVEGAEGRNSPCGKVMGADLAFTNLETPLTDGGVRADKLIPLRSSSQRAPDVKAVGFDIASFANNHALDYGIEGLYDTLRHMADAGVVVVGAGRNVAEALAPAFQEVGGVRVGFLGFSSTLPPGSVSDAGRPGIAPIRVKTWVEFDAAAIEEQPGTSPYVHTRAYELDVARAEQVVREAKAECDLLIAALHWGVPPGWRAPFQGPLADYQRPLGERLLAAGVDVIAGHHPHVLHGIEQMGPAGIILYSLGNFLFHLDQPGGYFELQRPAPPYQLEYVKDDTTRESFVAELEVTDAGQVVALRAYPVRLDARGNPTWATGETGTRILDRLLGFSEALDTTLGVSEDVLGDRRVLVAVLDIQQ
jgi:hypothetical protein